MRFPPRFLLRFVLELTLTLVGLALFAWAWRADRSWFESHVLWRFCAAEPSELRRVVITRIIAVVVGLLLIVIVRPRLGRWVSTNLTVSRAGSIGRLAVAALLALCVCDGALRILPRHRLPKPDPWIRPMPGYLWSNTPGLTCSVDYEGRTASYSIDATGDRIRSPEATLDPARPTILFTGESIAFGQGVNYDDTYAAKVGAALGIQSANSAVSGFGNDQVYERTREELARFANPLAVVTMIVPAQILRNIEPLRHHLLAKDDGTIDEIPATPAWIAQSPIRELFGNLFPYHSDEALRIARAALRATAREAQARGAYPIFVLSNWGPPCYPSPKGSPSVEEKLFNGLDLHVLVAPIDRTYWYEPSHHPDARGHDQVAKALIDALRPILSSRTP